MSDYYQGMFDLGAAIGEKLKRERQQAAREEAIRKSQQEAARQAAEAARQEVEAARQAEEEGRHQELISNLMNLDGTVGLKAEREGAPMNAKLMPLEGTGSQPPPPAESVGAKLVPVDEGGPVQPQSGSNFFGANPRTRGTDPGSVDLTSTGVNDPTQLKVNPSTLKQGGPCPLDANGMPECGAPAGAPMPDVSGQAIQNNQKYDPSGVQAPPSPPPARQESLYERAGSGISDQGKSATETGEDIQTDLKVGAATAGAVAGGIVAGAPGAAEGAHKGYEFGEGVGEGAVQYGRRIDADNLSAELKLRQQNLEKCGRSSCSDKE